MEGRLWSFMGIFTCKNQKDLRVPFWLVLFYNPFEKYMLIKLEHFPKIWGENPTPKMKPPT